MDIMDIMNFILSSFPHINPNGLPGHGLDLRYLFMSVTLPEQQNPRNLRAWCKKLYQNPILVLFRWELPEGFSVSPLPLQTPESNNIQNWLVIQWWTSFKNMIVLCKGLHIVLRVLTKTLSMVTPPPCKNPIVFQILLHIAITLEPLMQFETKLDLGYPLKSAHSLKVSWFPYLFSILQ